MEVIKTKYIMEIHSPNQDQVGGINQETRELQNRAKIRLSTGATRLLFTIAWFVLCLQKVEMLGKGGGGRGKPVRVV